MRTSIAQVFTSAAARVTGNRNNHTTRAKVNPLREYLTASTGLHMNGGNIFMRIGGMAVQMPTKDLAQLPNGSEIHPKEIGPFRKGSRDRAPLWRSRLISKGHRVLQRVLAAAKRLPVSFISRALATRRARAYKGERSFRRLKKVS